MPLKNELSFYGDEENACINYREKTVCFSSDEMIDKGHVEDDMFCESDFGYFYPLKTENYEKYRKMFKIVDILVPEHYGTKYRMNESGTTVRVVYSYPKSCMKLIIRTTLHKYILL